MSEKFQPPAEPKPEVIPIQEAIEELRELFTEAEKTLETHGRDYAKPFMGRIYGELKRMNQSLPDEKTFIWHEHENGLTQEQFNELNLRRKLLSNAIGIMTAGGVVRHDLEKI